MQEAGCNAGRMPWEGMPPGRNNVHKCINSRSRQAPVSSMGTDRLLASAASRSGGKEEAVQGSPWGTVAPGCCGVHKQQPHQAPHTGADEQHGHE